MERGTHRRYIAIATGLLGIGCIGYLLVRQRQLKKKVELMQSQAQCPKPSNVLTKVHDKAPETSKIAGSSPQFEKRSDRFPLALGSKGERVRQLQIYLMRHHGSAGVITDVFDEKTAERTKRFLKVDKVSKALYNVLERRLENHKNPEEYAQN